MRLGYIITTRSLNSKACSGNASSPSPQKFKVQASSGKIMCTIFWDAEGILLIDFMPQKVTITGVYYTDLLHKLHLAIKEKCEESWPKYPYFCTTMHLLTGHMLDKLLYLNPNLKKCITHHILLNWHQVITICFQIWSSTSVDRFSADDDLKYATEEWLKEQSELFYFTSIEKLRQRYKLCVDKGSDYIEKK